MKRFEDLKIDDIKTVIKITGTVNTRHIGGYKGLEGRITDELSFIRSDVPSKITDKDISYLLDRGIETVIDLRTKDEIAGSPVPFGEITDLSYVIIPFVSDDTPPHLMTDYDLGELYVHILEDRKENVAEALRTIARAEGGVFFNCSAGKDRTGILAMILLLLAGVDKDEVIKDYYFTEVLLQPWIKMMVPKLKEQGIEFNLKMLEAYPEYIETAINHIEKKYGNIENYVKSLGLSQTDIDKIINKVLK